MYWDVCLLCLLKKKSFFVFFLFLFFFFFNPIRLVSLPFVVSITVVVLVSKIHLN